MPLPVPSPREWVRSPSPTSRGIADATRASPVMTGPLHADFAPTPRRRPRKSEERGELSIAVALTLRNNTQMAIPAATYGVLMFFTAAAAGFLLRSSRTAQVPYDEARP